VVNGKEKLLLQKLRCRVSYNTTPKAPTPASTNAATPPSGAANQASAAELRTRRTGIMANGKKSLVLPP